MDSRLAAVLAQTDRAELGGRLRSARQARGLTQGEVADDLMSVAYLSRIESGHRQPTAVALETLAGRLDVSVESLLGVADKREVDEMRLALDYAELSLESGQPEEDDALFDAWDELHPPEDSDGTPGPTPAAGSRATNAAQTIRRMPYDFSPARVRCMELAVQLGAAAPEVTTPTPG
jgi:transcriptional regulator with XRE-family HTH domain